MRPAPFGVRDGAVGEVSRRCPGMAEPGRTYASITVAGEKVDPDEITALLGAAPEKSHRVGDHVSPRNTSTWKTGMWSISSRYALPDERDLATHIRWLSGKVSDDIAIWRGLADSHATRVFVYWAMEVGNEGLSLDAQTSWPSWGAGS